MVAFDRPPADIVLCVEGTANLGAYIEDLKQNYILPTLTYVYILIFASYTLDGYFCKFETPPWESPYSVLT